MTKNVAIVALCVACSEGMLRAATEPPSRSIAIALLSGADQEGFVDPKNVDSRHDIERYLDSCKFFRVVPNSPGPKTTYLDTPRLLLSVSRGIDKLDGFEPTYFESLNATLSVVPSLVFNADLKLVPTDDPYFKFFSKVASGNGWRYAAKQVINDICDWTKANYQRLAAAPPH